jgi:DNA modification methylase
MCKPKDLIGIPWMLAFALRSDDWYLRQDIIWAKPNTLPESVKDRCTKSHEYIFLLSKSSTYYFDNVSIQEPCVSHDNYVRDRDSTKLNNTPGRTHMGGLKENNYLFRNKRDVWNVSVNNSSEAHFATFPKDLILPCVLAGCPKNGVVLDPFNGSGTTGIVSVDNCRNYIGIELNPDYIEITKRRVLKECYNMEVVVQ